MSATTVALIEKAWLDPMENDNAAGYAPHGYMMSMEEAKNFCESQGFYTSEDCWAVKYEYRGKMPKYRCSELHLCS